jgi:methionyl-tRNA synthetase
MAVVSSANKYLSDMEPWKLKNSDPDRMASVLHVALQVVDDAKTLLTPFLPSSSEKVHALLHGEQRWAGMPELVELDEETAVGSPSYSVLTGDYDTGARWESTPIEVGRPLAAPTPIFTKLDPSVVEEELARLAPGE